MGMLDTKGAGTVELYPAWGCSRNGKSCGSTASTAVCAAAESGEMENGMDRFHGRDQKIRGNLVRELEKNKAWLEDILRDCDDVVMQEFQCGMEERCNVLILYTDGLTKAELLEESVIRPLLRKKIPYVPQCGTYGEEKIFQYVTRELLETADVKSETAMEDVVTQVLSGNTALLVEGCSRAVIVSSKEFPARGVQEADQEVAIRGPKDSFTEGMRSNTALIRRRIRDSRLKVKQFQAGERSKTDIALLYMEDLVKPEVLGEITKRLGQVSMDGILDSGMLEQLLLHDWKTPFPCFQRTQRPDKTASALLEGRIALVTDNSPEALLLPASFHVFFQASDDYYNRWEAASFARLLRYGAAILAIGLPAFYIAVASFHTEVLPTALILSFARAREGIPFPVVVEVLIMELAFELLREAGVRLPGQLGGTIGIVGGLIVGQAAVDAGIVSTIVVIVVALTAIASFSMPNETMATAFRMLKYFFIAMTAIWGLYGFFLAWLFVIVHLCGLEYFGEPYLVPDEWKKGERREKYKDYYLRLPLFTMWRRPVFTRRGARIRRKRTRQRK